MANNLSTRLDEICRAIRLLTAKSSTGGKIASWSEFTQITRTGSLDLFVQTGDYVMVNREKEITTHIANVNENTTAGVTGVTVDEEAFVTAIGTVENGKDYEFKYDGVEWKYKDSAVGATSAELGAKYGITYTGTAISGDEIVIHETAAEIPFRVNGLNHDLPSGRKYSVTLEAAISVRDSCQYDAPEAIIYTGEELAAGTYTIGIDSSYDKTYHTYDYYTFTAAAAIPAGAQIMFNWSWQKQPTGVTIYPEKGSKTGTTYAVTGEDTASGTLLCTANNTTIDTTSTNHVNLIGRARYGSNYYITSGIRQYMNTSAAKSDWWTPQTEFDRPHNLNTSRNWQYGLDPEFLAAITPVEKGIYTQKWDNGTDGNSTTTFTDKFFLLSYKELAGCTFSPYNNEAEGKQYEYYNNLIGAVTGDWKTYSQLKSYNANGSAVVKWLRSAHSGNTGHARLVGAYGHLRSNYATIGYSVFPACVIS